MHDAEPLILEELDRLAPRPEVGRPDWASVLVRAGAEKRPRRIAPLAAIAIVAVAVPAVAFSSGVRDLLGLGRPEPVLRSAEPIVSAPVGNNFFAHAWRSPSSTGGSCVFVTHDRAATTTRPRSSGGGSCTANGPVHVNEASRSMPLAPGLGIQRRLKSGDPRRWVPPVVFGSVYSKLHATRIVVEWKGGSHELALKNSWFIGGSPELYMPEFSRFPFVVVAYNADGKVVARKKLQSPTLLLLNGGWKEYARKYHAWQKRKP